MKTNAFVCAAASVLFLAGCDAAPKTVGPMMIPGDIHPVGAAIVYNTNERDVPWSTSETNPCNNDVIAITGTSHFVIHVGFDSNGGFHYNSNVMSRGTGNGLPSGNAYTMYDQDKYVDNTPASEGIQYVIHQSADVLVNGPGTASDYTKSFMFKVVVDNMGVPTASLEHSSIRCGK